MAVDACSRVVAGDAPSGALCAKDGRVYFRLKRRRDTNPVDAVIIEGDFQQHSKRGRLDGVVADFGLLGLSREDSQSDVCRGRRKRTCDDTAKSKTNLNSNLPAKKARLVFRRVAVDNLDHRRKALPGLPYARGVNDFAPDAEVPQQEKDQAGSNSEKNTFVYDFYCFDGVANVNQLDSRSDASLGRDGSEDDPWVAEATAEIPVMDINSVLHEGSEVDLSIFADLVAEAEMENDVYDDEYYDSNDENYEFNDYPDEEDSEDECFGGDYADY